MLPLRELQKEKKNSSIESSKKKYPYTHEDLWPQVTSMQIAHFLLKYLPEYFLTFTSKGVESAALLLPEYYFAQVSIRLDTCT